MEEILHTWDHKADLFADLVLDGREAPKKIAEDYFSVVPRVEYPDEKPDVSSPSPVERQSVEWIDADGNPVKFPLQLRMRIRYRRDVLKYVRD